MTVLDKPLNLSPIPFEVRDAIKKSFWQPQSLPKHHYSRLEWDPYFRYYDRQCREALIEDGRSVMARTHQDILDLIRCFEQNIPREHIKDGLRRKLSTPGLLNEGEVLDGAIDLAARLYLMVNVVAGAMDARIISAKLRVQWATGSLGQCLQAHFRAPMVLSSSGLRLEPSLTAVNLEFVAGIRIEPTDNLADHLRLLDQDRVVAVFCNVLFLERNTSPVLPDGLAAETLRTLSLLFPFGDKPTKQWLERKIHPEGLDTNLFKCDPLNLSDRQFEEFAYWHDRLVILKQAFDQSRPATITQWWYDRRNGVQWYTFWVAILVLSLTVFFGLVQSIEGALQVYKAFHPS